MKTTLDIVEIVWQHLNSVSSITSAISGKVHKHKRPANSTNEDVVINSLPFNNSQIQTGVVNVNVFCPDLQVTSNGITTNMPNHTRLTTLASLIIPYLTAQWTTEYNFDIQQQNLFEDTESKQHYINIRVEFFNINILN
jgi:hypothetical protein